MTRTCTFSLAALVLGLLAAPSPAIAADGSPFCAATRNQDSPSIAVDLSVGRYVAWRDLRRSDATTRTDLYVYLHPPIIAARTADPTLHAVNGFEWPADGLAVCESGTASAPFAVPDLEGGVLILFSDNRIPRGIYAQRVRADGTLAPGFPTDGKLVTSDVFDVKHAACSDGAGGAYFIRTRIPGGPGLVVATVSRVTSDGVIAPGWTEAGVTVGGDEIVEAISIGSDPAGGAVFMVRTRFPAAPAGIHITRVGRVSADAVLTLQKQIPAPSNVPTEARVIADAAGGIFAAWSEAAEVDFHGQHWAADGTATWPADHPVPAMEGLVLDGSGGVYLVGRPRDGSAKLRIARRDASGANDPSWNPDGETIAEPAALAAGVRAYPWGTGVGVLWSHSDGGPTGQDLRFTAYRPNSSLQLGFHPGGEVVSEGEGDQLNAVTDGFFIVWEDDREAANGKDLWASYFSEPGGEVGIEPTPRGEVLSLRAGPNPTSAATSFVCVLPVGGAVTIDVFDAAGRHVRALRPGTWPAGEHRVAWDGKDDAGRASPPGVYLARIEVGADVASGRVVRLP